MSDAEANRERGQRWRDRHPGATTARVAEWRIAHPNAESKRRARAKIANPEKYRASRHRNRLTTYGITPEDYARMLETQGGTCAVCHSPPTKERLCVDHDHVSGRVRGLLCRKCNSAIGQACESADRLRACAEYLDAAAARSEDA